MKRVLSVLLSLVFLAVCFVCFGVSAEGNAVRIVFTDGVPEWNGGDVAWNGSVLSIRGAGEYILSGSCPQGRVSLEAGKKDRVTLVLSGLEIASDTGRTFEITRADEVTLVLSDGTENKISALAEGGNGAAAVEHIFNSEAIMKIICTKNELIKGINIVLKHLQALCRYFVPASLACGNIVQLSTKVLSHKTFGSCY